MNRPPMEGLPKDCWIKMARRLPLIAGKEHVNRVFSIPTACDTLAHTYPPTNTVAPDRPKLEPSMVNMPPPPLAQLIKDPLLDVQDVLEIAEMTGAEYVTV